MNGSIEELKVGGQEALRLRHAAGDEVLVLKYGAQVLNWKTADGVERLYVSPVAAQPGQPVRGGVPVIFPQFNQRGPDFSLPRHGFARNLDWQLEGSELDADGVAALSLTLADNADSRLLWPQAFGLRLKVVLAPNQLRLQFEVRNAGDQPMQFTAALHTYFAVSDLRQTTLTGLAGCEKLDTLVNQPGMAGDDPLQLGGPIDDIFFAVPRPLTLQSGLGALRIDMSGGFRDVVVWNPGEATARGIKDMPAEDWAHMLCVEAACIQHPAQLQPGQSWQGEQSFAVQKD